MSGKPGHYRPPQIAIGARFGDWEAITEPTKNTKRDGYVITCKCICGTVRTLRTPYVQNVGPNGGCGCRANLALVKHGRSKGGRRTRLYNIWSNIRTRCNSAGSRDYHNYGGRGIKLCSEWDEFIHFERWALANGYADNLTIERLDVNAGYSPVNCTWIPRPQQLRNTRRSRWVELFGERKLLKDWATDQRCQVKYTTLYARMANGMSPELAITTPKGVRVR